MLHRLEGAELLGRQVGHRVVPSAPAQEEAGHTRAPGVVPRDQGREAAPVLEEDDGDGPPDDLASREQSEQGVPQALGVSGVEVAPAPCAGPGLELPGEGFVHLGPFVMAVETAQVVDEVLDVHGEKVVRKDGQLSFKGLGG